MPSVSEPSGGPRVVAVDDGHPEPVDSRALDGRHAEHEQAEHERARLPPGLERMARRLVVRMRGAVTVRKPRTAHGLADPDHDRDEQEVHGDRDAGGDHAGTEQRPGDGSDAEAGVEPRQDRPPQALLDERPLDVHGDVPGAVADAEQEQPDDDREDSHAVAQRRDRETDRAEDRHDRDRAGGAQPRDHRPSQRQGDERARRHGQQQQAEAGRAEVQAIAHLRDARGPACKREAGAEEDVVDRTHGPPQAGVGSRGFIQSLARAQTPHLPFAHRGGDVRGAPAAHRIAFCVRALRRVAALGGLRSRCGSAGAPRRCRTGARRATRASGGRPRAGTACHRPRGSGVRNRWYSSTNPALIAWRRGRARRRDVTLGRLLHPPDRVGVEGPLDPGPGAGHRPAVSWSTRPCRPPARSPRSPAITATRRGRSIVSQAPSPRTCGVRRGRCRPPARGR